MKNLTKKLLLIALIFPVFIFLFSVFAEKSSALTCEQDARAKEQQCIIQNSCSSYQDDEYYSCTGKCGDKYEEESAKCDIVPTPTAASSTPAVCSGTPKLAISPATVSLGEAFTLTASGLTSECKTKTVKFLSDKSEVPSTTCTLSDNSCSSSTSITGSAGIGILKYTAWVDENGNSNKDSGEVSNEATLTVSAPTAATTPKKWQKLNTTACIASTIPQTADNYCNNTVSACPGNADQSKAKKITCNDTCETPSIKCVTNAGNAAASVLCAPPVAADVKTADSCSSTAQTIYASCGNPNRGKGSFCNLGGGITGVCDGGNPTDQCISYGTVSSCCGIPAGVPCTDSGKQGLCTTTATCDTSKNTSGTEAVTAVCPPDNASAKYLCQATSPNGTWRSFGSAPYNNCSSQCWYLTIAAPAVGPSSQCGASDCGTCQTNASCQQVAGVATKQCTCQLATTTTTTTTVPPTNLAFQFKLDGISGQPQHKNISYDVQILDQEGAEIKKITGIADSFDPVSGSFRDTLRIDDATQIFPSGTYTVKIKVNKYLTRQIPGIAITSRSTTNIPAINPIVGDMNGDNKVDSSDYSVFLGCYKTKALSNTTCLYKSGPYSTESSAGTIFNADLDDNSVVDAIDLNILLRSFSLNSTSTDKTSVIGE